MTPFYQIDGSTITTGTGRIYYTPLYVAESRSFAGVATFNTAGTASGGETYRVGLYSHTAAAGPTALEIDFGQVTLTTTNAERVLSSAVSLTKGWHWWAIQTQQAIGLSYMFSMGGILSAAGYAAQHFGASFKGAITTATVSTNKGFMYVDTAYGALATAAVAPTTDTNLAPAIWIVA